MFKNAVIPLIFLSFSALAESPSKVMFDAAGITLIDGKPFFPVGIFNYSPDTAALADIRKHGFNTLVATTENHKPEHLDLISSYGLRIICPPTDAWSEPAKKHPAMLAWYLADEPEGHGQTPTALREKYLQLKQKDPGHPIALDHFLLDSLPAYKDAADLTMTSYYPLLAGGGPALENFAVYLENSRLIHGKTGRTGPLSKSSVAPIRTAASGSSLSPRKSDASSTWRWSRAPRGFFISPTGRRRQRRGRLSAS